MQADSAQQQGLYRPEFDHDACGIGALADINGERHHQILDDALSILVNLEHRGGTGLEKNTGDGAGILFQVPHHFFRKEAQKCGQILPAEGDYGVAMLFFPQDDKGVEDARRVFEEGCAEAGVPLLFWREVPVDPHDLGETARACMPTILQAFLGRPDDTPAGDAFERRLYVCRRTIEKKADAEFALRDKIFYVCSMSSRTIVYKGMLVATQMRRFFIDLNDAAVKTASPTRATPPTPRPAGSARTPTALSSTTARSTPSRVTSTGFAPASPTCTAPCCSTILSA